MPVYLHPGVYIEETSYRGKPIQGVSTSTAGFVGAARKGFEANAVFVPSFAHFRRLFGDPIKTPTGMGDLLGHSVKSFFDNGGARCYVVRCLAGDALAASIGIEQGTVLQLAPGVTVRGPTRQLRLNSLRGVEVGTVLRFFTRTDAQSSFLPTRTGTVDSYDAVRGTVTLTAADELPSGVVLDPEDTAILITGSAPASVASTETGAVFTARHRGEDGNTVSVQVQPSDRPVVAITGASARRENPILDLDPVNFPMAAGTTTLQFTIPALRLLQAGDQLSIGSSSGLIVQTIADGDIDFDVNGGGAGGDFSGGATLRLTARSGTVFGTPMELGAAPAALAIDLTGGAPAGPVVIEHRLAALLKAGDIFQLDDGAGATTDLSVTATRVAQEIAAGAHVTIAAGVTVAEAAPVEARLTETSNTDPNFMRLFVGNASDFTAPANTTAAESIGITDGTATENANAVLVDPATNLLYFDRTGVFPGTVTHTNWTGMDVLQVVSNGQTSVRVANTASFYSGGKVELDSGTNKFELTVDAIDPANRTITFTSGVNLGLGGVINLPADPAVRHVYLRTCELTVRVYENDTLVETFEQLTWNPDDTKDAGLHYYVSRLNDDETGSKFLTALEAPASGLSFAEAPVTANGLPRQLANGSNGGALTDLDLIGTDRGPGNRTGIQALTERADISMVAVPGVTSEVVQGQLITHCERMRYRMAVLDSPVDAGDVTALQAHRNNYDSKYAAYYAPWLKALNFANGRIEAFPPCGYAMGIYARTDTTVGVHKAPANEVVRNITDVVLPYTEAEQDVVNPVGINLIRNLAPRGIRVWGARTISSDQEWKYVNIRRLFIFMEHSIDLGTQWVVFEPNSESLWSRVVETITAFLIGVWKSGALMGTTPEEAFFVTCDRTTMTQDDIDNGRLVCEIGVAPVAPAEFVIFRIGQFTASSDA